MPFSTLLVDDEPLARDGLRMWLERDPEVSSIREVRDGPEAVAAIREARPDLVFLDVQMPGMDGFAVLREVGAERMPAVVFVTAHDRFAIQAFEVNAVDYLLKPATEERFRAALVRAKERLRSAPAEEASRQILGLLEAIAAPSRYLKRLAVRSGSRTLLVEVPEIDWIRSAENYVELHVGAASHLLPATLSALERSLDPEAFLRIHRSVLVNVRRIREMETGPHGELILLLEGGVRLQCGRTYTDKVRTFVTPRF